jgi:hypothetical protein
MMTEKQAMGLVYYKLGKVTLVERDGNKNIFSSGDRYMVAVINGDNSSVSDVYNTLEEAQAW